MNNSLSYSDAGIALTKFYEAARGPRLEVYPDDSRGILTIGWGHTGKDVHPGMCISVGCAEQLLQQDVANAVRVVRGQIICELTQGQFDALVDFVFNFGGSDLYTSTLRKILNGANPDFDAAANEFKRWNKALNKNTALMEPVKGLTKRRAAEEAMFRGYSDGLAVACDTCDQQPWEPCVDPTTGYPFGNSVHPKRFDGGQFVAGASADSNAVPITDDAILKTGLV